MSEPEIKLNGLSRVSPAAFPCCGIEVELRALRKLRRFLWSLRSIEGTPLCKGLDSGPLGLPQVGICLHSNLLKGRVRLPAMDFLKQLLKD